MHKMRHSIYICGNSFTLNFIAADFSVCIIFINYHLLILMKDFTVEKSPNGRQRRPPNRHGGTSGRKIDSMISHGEFKLTFLSFIPWADNVTLFGSPRQGIFCIISISVSLLSLNSPLRLDGMLYSLDANVPQLCTTGRVPVRLPRAGSFQACNAV